MEHFFQLRFFKDHYIPLVILRIDSCQIQVQQLQLQKAQVAFGQIQERSALADHHVPLSAVGNPIIDTVLFVVVFTHK